MGFSPCTNRVMGTDQVLMLIFSKLKYVLKVNYMRKGVWTPDCHTKYMSLFPKCCREAESTQLYRMSLNAVADLPKLFQHRSAPVHKIYEDKVGCASGFTELSPRPH